MTDTAVVAADPLAAPFVEGLMRGELRYQSCSQCGAAQSLVRFACHACGSRELHWRTASGLGRIHAITIVQRAPTEEFRALAPYALALVELDEGLRVMGHAEPHLSIGAPVVAEFFTLGSRRLLRFVASNGARA